MATGKQKSGRGERPQDAARGGGASAAKNARIAGDGELAVGVVGIGASAGGLAALKTFFRNVADDSGFAYVVIVHLSPEHESHLATLLQPHSRMPVLQITESTRLEPNRVYVIPPNANVNAIDTHLRLSPLERPGLRAPIDHFFRTLAQTFDGHAIGVVLTGSGSDGTIGVREIKLRAGLTVAQDPAEAEFDSMPLNAISTGFVDLVLPLASIPGAIRRWSQTEPRLPAVDAGTETLAQDDRALLQKLFAQVRMRTGRDFARYKLSTVMRRIERRMQLRNVVELDRYVELLGETPDEVRALSDDLLVTVTSFFRDTAVFERIERDVIPYLFEGRSPGDDVRVWCVGCATGEEVYSIAMLLLEKASELDGRSPRLQVFASDLHEKSIQVAREGFYPGDISSEVSPGRLRRFFVEEAGGYRVRKELREIVVFTNHNLLGDPPFSRLDLVVCRNLMIYLQRDVQTDVAKIFHYALRPGGYLVLGGSETVDDAELFRTVDKQHSIYRRGFAPSHEARLPAFPVARRSPGNAAAEARAPQSAPEPYEEMHDDFVRRTAPPSALVGPDDQVVHLSRQAGRYLQHPGGRLTASVGKLVRPELAVELIAALHAARQTRRPVTTKPVRVRFDGNAQPVVLHVTPAPDSHEEGYCLVVFEERDEPSRASPMDAAREPDNELERQLAESRQQLRNVVEQFESSREEMKASNEELQSANEELRSTMEELETSKEELQSMNEELQTVNQENRHKVEELALVTADLQNLLTSTDIATLFLDRELRIQRFTPKVHELVNIRAVDRGRPIFDLTHRLAYPELRADAEAVLAQLVEIEREVMDELGRWYLTHLRPYRSRDERVEGVVLTFVDITRRKTSEAELQELTRTLEERVAKRTRQVRALTTSLVRAEQRERRRLSETLHDELQQLLYGAALKLRLARHEGEQGRMAEQDRQLRQAEDLLARSTAITRRLSIDLNPPILRHEGLRSILTWLQSHMRDLHNLDVDLEADEEVHIENPDARVMLFQVVRELLFNVAKHAGVDKVAVRLRSQDGELEVVVADRGGGFDPASVDRDAEDDSSLGLTNVKERVNILGGRVEIESAAGRGTQVTVRAPVSAAIGEA
jgi:two-component system CheB/CheR fusion protein